MGTISLLTLSRIWKSLRRSSSHFFRFSRPPILSKFAGVRNVLDHAAAVDEQPLLFEQGRHRFGTQPAPVGERTPNAVTRLIERQSLQGARELLEQRVGPGQSPQARVSAVIPPAGDRRVPRDQAAEVRYK